jgi:hypothetical protein
MRVYDNEPCLSVSDCATAVRVSIRRGGRVPSFSRLTHGDVSWITETPWPVAATRIAAQVHR